MFNFILVMIIEVFVLNAIFYFCNNAYTNPVIYSAKFFSMYIMVLVKSLCHYVIVMLYNQLFKYAFLVETWWHTNVTAIRAWRII